MTVADLLVAPSVLGGALELGTASLVLIAGFAPMGKVVLAAVVPSAALRDAGFGLLRLGSISAFQSSAFGGRKPSQ